MFRQLILLLIALTFMSFAPPPCYFQIGAKKHSIHYIEKGVGDKHIILLHGFSANTYTWHNQMDLLARQGYHVWALDFLGFGCSAKPDNITYSMDLYRAQVIQFMDAKKISSAHIMGHSMGGGVSLALALGHKERVRSLILVDPAGYPLKTPQFLVKYTGVLLYPFVNETMLRFALKKIFYDTSKITEEKINAYWRPFETSGAKWAAINALKTLDNDKLEAQSAHYAKLRTPTLIIWGGNDKLTPLRHLDRYKKDMPHAETTIIKECGHAPHEECPELFNAKMCDFLLK